MVDPGSAERPKMIDGNKLRKENWTLGSYQFKFESINKTAYDETDNQPDSRPQKAELNEIKQRIKAVNATYKTGAQDPATIASYFQTNSSSQHRQFDNIETMDQKELEERKKKLSDSSFNLGHSPLSIKTMNEKHHYPMGSIDLQSMDDRKRVARRNYMTNFINPNTGSFEKQGQFASFN